MNEYTVARGLGWFSIGLGLVELLAPRPIARVLGTPHTGLIRVFGLGELVAGVGILAPNKPTTPWFWARLGGDALNLAALGLTYQNNKATRKAVGLSVATAIAVTAFDLWCTQQLKPYKWPIDQQQAPLENDLIKGNSLKNLP